MNALYATPSPVELFRAALSDGVRNIFDAATEQALGPWAQALKASEDFPICRYDGASCAVMELLDPAGTGRGRWYVKSTHASVTEAEADLGPTDVLLILVD